MSARRSRHWAVASTLWREEQRAAHHVENLGLRYYLPMTIEWRGELERRVLLFPGFIFVQIRSGWSALARAKGIARVLTVPLDDETMVPARVSDEEISRMRALEDASGVVRLSPRLRDGQTIVVGETGGSFAGVSGIVEGTPERGRVQVLMRMLGRVVKKDFAECDLQAA